MTKEELNAKLEFIVNEIRSCSTELLNGTRGSRFISKDLDVICEDVSKIIDNK